VDEQGFARCSRCDAVFLFPADVDWGDDAKAFRRELPALSGLTVTPREAGEHYTWRLEESRRMYGILAAVCWSVLFAMIAFAPHGPHDVWPYLVGVPALAFGASASWLLLETLVGSWELAIRDGWIVRKCLPLTSKPWSHPTAHIDALFVRHRFDRRGASWFDVVAPTEGLDARIATFSDPGRAVFVARSLRERLGLQEEPAEEASDTDEDEIDSAHELGSAGEPRGAERAGR
jgi:hypothetical protein